MIMIEKPRIVQTSAQPVAIIRVTVPREQIREVMDPGRRELFDGVAAQGVAIVGPWFTHHLRMDPKVFDFEIGVPVAEPVTASGRVEPAELPAATVARTLYHGPYEGLGPAWGEFGAWVESQGHTPAPDLWECYLFGPESSPDPASWRTELNRPLIRLGPSGG
jgi:effector-binding domain-containing protein